MELVERIWCRCMSRRPPDLRQPACVSWFLKALGQSVCENTVAKADEAGRGIRSIVRGRFLVRTTDASHGHPVAPNKLERCFQRDLPNQAWCADITYIPTAEGWLYLSAVIDLCSRKVVGWSMADHPWTELCMDALDMALGASASPGRG